MQMLRVSNLSDETTKAQLHKLFSKAGKILAINIISDRHSGAASGVGFVIMSTDSGAVEAIKHFDGYLFNDRVLSVSDAQAEAGVDNRYSRNRQSEDF
jgi:RNA recognition motif-containing protein